MDQQPQQPQRVTFEEIIVWIADRKMFVLGGIAAIGIAGLVIVSYQSSAEGKEHRATAALFHLQAASNAKTNEPTVAEYQALLPQTEGTGITQHIKLREAASLFADGKYAEAQLGFEAFGRDFPESRLLPEAYLGGAASLEAQGKAAEALSRYQELSTRFAQSSLVSRARLGQARLFEKQGEQQQAFRIFQELASQTLGGGGQFGQAAPLQVDASIAARRMVKANPALIQTIAPSATPLIAPTTLPLTVPAGAPAELPRLTNPSAVPLTTPAPADP